MSTVDLSDPETFTLTKEDYLGYLGDDGSLTNCVARKNPNVPFCEAMKGCSIPDADIDGKSIHMRIRDL